MVSLKRLLKKFLGCSGCECLSFDDLALAIAKKEGGKKEQNIAEIREILSVTLDLMAKHDCDYCLLDFISRRGRKK